MSKLVRRNLSSRAKYAVCAFEIASIGAISAFVGAEFGERLDAQYADEAHRREVDRAVSVESTELQNYYNTRVVSDHFVRSLPPGCYELIIKTIAQDSLISDTDLGSVTGEACESPLVAPGYRHASSEAEMAEEEFQNAKQKVDDLESQGPEQGNLYEYSLGVVGALSGTALALYVYLATIKYEARMRRLDRRTQRVINRLKKDSDEMRLITTPKIHIN